MAQTPGIIHSISQQQYEEFVNGLPITPEGKEQMLQQPPREQIREHLRVTGQRTDEAFVDRAVSIVRAKIAQAIKENGDKGIPWDMMMRFLK